MSHQLCETLKRLHEIRELEAMAKEATVSPSVFLSPEGHRWNERNFRRSWYRCLAKAGIRHIRFHDLRHTFVSLFVEHGTYLRYVQEQAGHSGIQVTMDTYVHLFPNRDRG